jgi:hypothetical protein
MIERLLRSQTLGRIETKQTCQYRSNKSEKYNQSIRTGKVPFSKCMPFSDSEGNKVESELYLQHNTSRINPPTSFTRLTKERIPGQVRLVGSVRQRKFGKFRPQSIAGHTQEAVNQIDLLHLCLTGQQWLVL